MRKEFEGRAPALSPSSRLAENAVAVGDVTLEDGASVWYGAVLRGDESSVCVGAGSNIQDNAVLHCDQGFPLSVGRDVTVGHGAILHGCTVGDRCIVGMGAVLLNGCVIGEGSIVAAGTLVTQNKIIPPGSMVMGAPAKVARPLTQEECAQLDASAEGYRHAAARQLPAAGGRYGA